MTSFSTADDHADTELRERALVQLRKKEQFQTHVRVYVLVNTLHVVIWAAVLAARGVAFFWPIFPALGWAIGLGFNAWDVYRGDDRKQVPEEGQIRHEMDALQTQAELRGMTR